MLRDPKTNRWDNADRNPDWEPQPGALVVGSEGPLFYANSVSVKDHIHALVRARDPAPAVVVFEMSESPDLDVGTLDMLGELAAAQGSTTASASSRPSPTPPANRRACQP
jgi:SulP family sulfate permease